MVKGFINQAAFGFGWHFVPVSVGILDIGGDKFQIFGFEFGVAVGLFRLIGFGFDVDALSFFAEFVGHKIAHLNEIGGCVKLVGVRENVNRGNFVAARKIVVASVAIEHVVIVEGAAACLIVSTA